jgi:electron transport complex, RnfABCDGE type, B subunit
MPHPRRRRPKAQRTPRALQRPRHPRPLTPHPERNGYSGCRGRATHRRATAANAVHTLRLPGLRSLRAGHCRRRGDHQPLPARRCRRRGAACGGHGPAGAAACPRVWPGNGAQRGLHRRKRLHWLHPVPQGLPTDAIVGTNKRMHTVIEAHCTGCELCLPACPVDCIHLANVSGAATGWAAWSQAQADAARERYARRQHRLAQKVAPVPPPRPAATESAHATTGAPQAAPSAPPSAQARQAAIAAALERARQKRMGS